MEDIRHETTTSDAMHTLYNSGVLARSPEEAELLDWFRQLAPDEQLLELARAKGMAQAMSYVKMKGA